MNSAQRYRAEKFFWLVMIVPTVMWLGKTTMFVSLVSIYALVLSAAAAEAAAEAKETQQATRFQGLMKWLKRD